MRHLLTMTGGWDSEAMPSEDYALGREPAGGDGWGLHLTTEDLARFGQFCLDEGAVDGAQGELDVIWHALVPAFAPGGDQRSAKAE